MKLGRRLAVECVGSAWLVFAGCAGAAINANLSVQGGGGVEMAAAFGLALGLAVFVTPCCASAHFNPAVTVGHVVAGRFPVRGVALHIVAQTLGATAGAALLAWVASGRPGFSVAGSEFGANGYGEHSPLDYRPVAVFGVEAALTFVFVSLHLLVGACAKRRRSAPAALGACFAVLYLIAIPVSNGGLNPARSTGPALFVGDWALDQLWLFWAAPMAGGIAAGLCQRYLPLRRELPHLIAGSHGDA